MRVYQVVIGAVVIGVAVPVLLHERVHGHFEANQIVLAFFLWLNTVIAFWELCLFARRDLIVRRHAQHQVKYEGRPFDRLRDFFFTRVPVTSVLSPTLWSEVWSCYALFDDSYSKPRSLGFVMDMGNGFSTLLPSILALYGMTFDLLPARALGAVLLVLSYQTFYGTVLYGTTVAQRPPQNRSVLLVMVLVNAPWLLFPIWGAAVGATLIHQGTFAVLRP